MMYLEEDALEWAKSTNEGDEDEGSGSWAFAADSMHNEDLGVFLYIIKKMQVIKGIHC